MKSLSFLGNENSDSFFLNILNDLGGWPSFIGDKWTGANFDWVDLFNKMRNYGFDIDFPISVSINNTAIYVS